MEEVGGGGGGGGVYLAKKLIIKTSTTSDCSNTLCVCIVLRGRGISHVISTPRLQNFV